MSDTVLVLARTTPGVALAAPVIAASLAPAVTGDGKNDDQIAKMAAAMYMLLRGTPIMYYGEEIGMENNDPKRKEDVQDPQGRRGWPNEIGRDGERTPMQWTPDRNAGFSHADPARLSHIGHLH